jgi:uncharacterized membrane protein YdjX (TVP38/TMEM64 family)
VLVGLYAVLSPLGAPATPLVLTGGLVFGVVWGSLWNAVGTFVGAATSYLFARTLGRELVAHLFGQRLRRVEAMLARGGFWTLVRTRIMPIPFPVINYGAALAGVPLPLFLSSTAVGQSPTIVVYTYFAAVLFEATGARRGPVVAQALAAFVLLFALTYLPRLFIGRQRRRRYRALLAERRARVAARRGG